MDHNVVLNESSKSAFLPLLPSFQWPGSSRRLMRTGEEDADFWVWRPIFASGDGQLPKYRCDIKKKNKKKKKAHARTHVTLTHTHNNRGIKQKGVGGRGGGGLNLRSLRMKPRRTKQKHAWMPSSKQLEFGILWTTLHIHVCLRNLLSPPPPPPPLPSAACVCVCARACACVCVYVRPLFQVFNWTLQKVRSGKAKCTLVTKPANVKAKKSAFMASFPLPS